LFVTAARWLAVQKVVVWRKWHRFDVALKELLKCIVIISMTYYACAYSLYNTLYVAFGLRMHK
jgi:hypothetical protein